MRTSVVIPNWNGLDFLAEALDSLLAQSVPIRIVVVDNGSIDGSRELVRDSYPTVDLVSREINEGFAGGVNRGIEHSLALDAEYIVLFNNDAVADPHFVAQLVNAADARPEAGIVTPRFVQFASKNLDSTGDFYSVWGICFARGRDEPDVGSYDSGWVFGGTGGASLYRADMFRDIGLFDEEFFAYFEDADLSFRAQIAGWKVWYESTATALHRIGGTSGKLGDFTRYHATKNFFYMYLKNMPAPLFWKYLPRFLTTAGAFAVSNVLQGKTRVAGRAYARVLQRRRELLRDRARVQGLRRVEISYLDGILHHAMPPGERAHLSSALRRLRLRPARPGA